MKRITLYDKPHCATESMISNIQSKQNMEKALNDRTGTFQALDDREHEGDTSCVTLGYTKLTCSISLET